MQVLAVDLVDQHFAFPGGHVETEESPVVVAHQQVPVSVLLDAEWPPAVLPSTTDPAALTRTTSPLVRPMTTDPVRSISTSSAPVPGSSTTDTGSVIGVPRRADGGCQRAGRCDDMDPRVSFDYPGSSALMAQSGRRASALCRLLTESGFGSF